MTFDVRAKVFDEAGDYDEKSGYREALLGMFQESPEAEALGDVEMGWADSFVHYGLDYIGVTPAQMRPDHVEEIVFDIIPRKVVAEPGEAGDAVREIRAFWDFVKRRFGLENAEACRSALGGDAERRLEERLADPGCFGMAKSFLTTGGSLGFDLGSEGGLGAWVTAYNAMLSGAGGQDAGKKKRKAARKARRKGRR